MLLPTDPDCYWVEPGRLIAGEYPGSTDETTARIKLAALLECGVRTFIDLTEQHELQPYEPFLTSEASARGLSVTYHRKSIPDLRTPSAHGMRDILGTMKSSVEEDSPVYVHCWGGVGRTGTVVGCWLIEQRQCGDDPIAAITKLRAGIRKAVRTSPETPEQVTYVRNWPAPRTSTSA